MNVRKWSGSSVLFLPALALLAASCATLIGEAPVPETTPEQALAELLAADRQFSEQASKDGLIEGLSAMFAADVVMPVPGGRFARDRGAAIVALQENPDNAGARASWEPVRGALSADGLHGMSYGFMTVTRADQSVVPAKYLAYWIKGDDGWKVAVYKRTKRPEGEPKVVQLPAILPQRLVRPNPDKLEEYRSSLDQAERAFSDAAQKIGLGTAFKHYGGVDSVNLGGGENVDFVHGATAIGELVGAGLPPEGSPVTWAPDQVIVAGSGDFGVTIGFLAPKEPAADGSKAADIPFFTIWRRPTLTDPWHYIGE